MTKLGEIAVVTSVVSTLTHKAITDEAITDEAMEFAWITVDDSDQEKFEEDLQKLMAWLSDHNKIKCLMFTAGGSLKLPDWFKDYCNECGILIVIMPNCSRATRSIKTIEEPKLSLNQLTKKTITSIDLFLNQQIYSSNQHPKHWDKYAYDDEKIHYVLLKILSESCYSFSETLLGLPNTPKSVRVIMEPHGGLFDLEFIVDGVSIYCEVKIWANLSSSQFNRQITFLGLHGYDAIYILFTKAAAAWSSSLSTASGGRCRAISLQNLMNALNSIGTNIPIELAEIVAAYQTALISLASRY